jgi:hypothetical protein
MFVITLVHDLGSTWFIYPILFWHWFLDIRTSSTDWAQLSRFPREDRDRIQSLKLWVLNKNRTLDNVQKHANCIVVDSLALILHIHKLKDLHLSTDTNHASQIVITIPTKFSVSA